jgi:hypothetical protein
MRSYEGDCDFDVSYEGRGIWFRFVKLSDGAKFSDNKAMSRTPSKLEPSDQSMKPIAHNFNLFATTPCRGLSLSR